MKHLDDFGYIRLDANVNRINVEFVRTNPHDGERGGLVWDAFTVAPWK